MATLLPTIAFVSVDFPALGLPTRATKPLRKPFSLRPKFEPT